MYFFQFRKEFLEEICPLLKVKYENEKVQCLGKITPEEEMVWEVLDVNLKSMEEIYQQVKQKHREITLFKVMELVMELMI